MDDRLYDAIFVRKSFHRFGATGGAGITPRQLDGIRKAFSDTQPLCPDIRTQLEIVTPDRTTCRCGEEYCLLFYSETKDNYLQNIGYIGQQLELYLVGEGIGTVWHGIGRPFVKRLDGLTYVIMIAIARIDDRSRFRQDLFAAKRKGVSEIWVGDRLGEVADIVRFAPSACNLQPWKIENSGDSLKVFRYRAAGRRGIMPASMVTYYNRIDMGILLCILELCLAHGGYAFDRRLEKDDGGGAELTLTAAYTLSGCGEASE